MKKNLSLSIVMILSIVLQPSLVFAEDDVNLKREVSRLKAELENMALDRKNLVKQAAMFQSEKDELLQKIEEIKGSDAGSDVQIESLQKENELMKSEIEKLKAAREKDRALYEEQKQSLESEIEDHQARADTLHSKMEDYDPEKIDELVADRNRLAEENERLAQKIFDQDKLVEQMKKEATPLQLDREELQRLRAENSHLMKRIQYVEKLETRQQELIAENAKYREDVQILKAKFKDAAPGLAKASRISQKMMKENADMHYNLGTIFLHNKQYRESIKEYERVLELRPNDPETHYNLGILYDDFLKDRDKALYHFQKYLAINPKAPDAKNVESYILSLELEQKVR